MVIARVMGGLGNQLFIYAAARSLSLKNKVPLVLDTISGFERDIYRRSYRLHHFNIKGEVARSRALSGLMGRARRHILKRISKYYAFERRRYITEETSDFDVRLLNLTVNQTVYLDGYWQSEKYFKDYEQTIRNNFKIVSPHNSENLNIAKQIQATNSVVVHVRRLREFPGKTESKPNPSYPSLGIDYYKKGIDIIASKVTDPVIFCFGDYPQWLVENIKIDFPIIIINHNKEEKDYEDLWLMSLCKHFIISNSTFSWWGAWLHNCKEKIVITPDRDKTDRIPGMEIFAEGSSPADWLKI